MPFATESAFMCKNAHAETWACKVSLSSVESWCPERSLSILRLCCQSLGIWGRSCCLLEPQLWQVEASVWGRTLPQLQPHVSPHPTPLSASWRRVGMHRAHRAQAAQQHPSCHGHRSTPNMAHKSCCGAEHFWSWAWRTWCEGVWGSSCSPDPLSITKWKP